MQTEPVWEWLKSLSAVERKTIGEDIKTVQFGWPLGMPLVRKMDANLWEVRISLAGRVARVEMPTGSLDSEFGDESLPHFL